MLSKPLALVFVATACVVAAGAGAYIATLQHARSDAAMAAGQDFRSAGVAPAQASESPAGPASQAPIVSLPAQPAPDDLPTAPPVVAAPKATTGTTTPGAARSSAARSVRTEAAAARSSQDSAPQSASSASETSTADGAAQKPWPGNAGSSSQPPPSVPAPPDVPAREQEPAERQQVWEEVTVPSESVIGLLLETPLNSEYARVEDRVDARVTREVRVDGRVAIPAGTHAIGSVLMVERGGKIRERARLGIRFHSLVLPDTTRVPITTDTIYRDGEPPSNRSSAKIGGAAIGGAIIGAILGGGKGAAIGSGIGAAGGTAAAMAGDRRPIVLPAGTPLSVRIQSSVTVTVEK